MKLRILPASRGIQWVRQGIQTFFRQPLALTGLFFMFLVAMSLLSLVPWVGNVLALALFPGANLGLMVATRETSEGRFPMPLVMVSAFRAGRAQLQAMLILGVLYAGGFMLVLACSALFDGGKFASLNLGGGHVTAELMQEADFQTAMLVAAALYAPLSLVFWHAPALVHWQGVAPVKSLFFSFVACIRNFWAFTVYGIVWILLFLVSSILSLTLASMLGGPQVLAAILYPAAILLAAMFFMSIYFTFVDNFEITPGDQP